MSTKTDAMSEEEQAMVGSTPRPSSWGRNCRACGAGAATARRIKGPPGQGHCFHVMSRLTGDVPMWDALEKEALVKLLWKMSAFCGWNC